MTHMTSKTPDKLVQFKIPSDVKNKLDKIFEYDGTTTPQGLKMIATQIANHGFSPFTTVQYEQYSEPVSDEIKSRLREDDLKALGILPDDNVTYKDEESLKQAFKTNLDN